MHPVDVDSGWRSLVSDVPSTDEPPSGLHPRLFSREDEVLVAVRRSLEFVDDEAQDFAMAIPRAPKAPEDLKRHVRALERKSVPEAEPVLETPGELAAPHSTPEPSPLNKRELIITAALGFGTTVVTAIAGYLAWQLFLG
jgi:hypothetical protein